MSTLEPTNVRIPLLAAYEARAFMQDARLFFGSRKAPLRDFGRFAFRQRVNRSDRFDSDLIRLVVVCSSGAVT